VGVGTVAVVDLPFAPDAPPCAGEPVAHGLSDDMDSCEMIG
jgi:hypothetical protein